MYASHIYCGAVQVCWDTSTSTIGRKHKKSRFYLGNLNPLVILGLCVPQLRQIVGREVTQEISKRVFGFRSCVVSVSRRGFLLISSFHSLVAFSLVLGITAAHFEIGGEWFVRLVSAMWSKFYLTTHVLQSSATHLTMTLIHSCLGFSEKKKLNSTERRRRKRKIESQGFSNKEVVQKKWLPYTPTAFHSMPSQHHRRQLCWPSKIRRPTW